ncbi:hypothetical protein B0T26DRAFT_753549 [Lasiosphaeria miniovina]|uniref:Uncharacterized protein n=1 Tax=Lasiosphaeria miniovina TaxID=1954250 RepID=A0AA40ACM2_9PEZI|nr:uncharacterized protein B0T26DRAFT_753549 [Lasiosphaeria miniovina]KAK0713442.1 hypothetical protein B0T26DRAFT_753549 [Lasiosphaeria miniovina]
MLGVDRQHILDSSDWISTDNEHPVRYIEAWRHAEPVEGDETAGLMAQGELQDAEANDWLVQTGSFAKRDSKEIGSPKEATRLVICERYGWKPLGFEMSQDSFLAIESSFRLPPETLSILNSDGGQYHYALERSRFESANTVRSMTIIVKLPQMFQLGNWGLALSHSFDTSTTSAFLHGWNVLSDYHPVTRERVVPAQERIGPLIYSAIGSCGRPTLLPIILLKEHLSRINLFMGELESTATAIESTFKVTKSGRLANSEGGPLELMKLMANEEERTKLTTLLNTTMTDTVNLTCVIKWDRRYCKFLKELHGVIRTFDSESSSQVGESELEIILRHLECDLESAFEYVESIAARLNLQLTVLYNLVAQAENDLTARMTAATGLDSAAMKTLAFVTTVFLPPTFIATLFSMSMFDWQAGSTSPSSPDGGGLDGYVVRAFWVYWAVSVPLTILVLVGWRVWWHHQRSQYARQYQHRTQTKEGSKIASEAKLKKGWAKYLRRRRVEPDY